MQTETLAEITRKVLAKRQGNINSIKSVGDASDAPEEPPEWFKNYVESHGNINTVKPPPKPHPAARPDRGRPAARTSRSGSPKGRASPGRGRQGNGSRSPSAGPSKVVGWDNKCFHCGSNSHGRKDCKLFNDMMAKENGSKPKEQWRPPAGYKSALGRARDEQKAQDTKKVAAI